MRKRKRKRKVERKRRLLWGAFERATSDSRKGSGNIKMGERFYVHSIKGAEMGKVQFRMRHHLPICMWTRTKAKAPPTPLVEKGINQVPNILFKKVRNPCNLP